MGIGVVIAARLARSRKKRRPSLDAVQEVRLGQSARLSGWFPHCAAKYAC